MQVVDILNISVRQARRWKIVDRIVGEYVFFQVLFPN